MEEPLSYEELLKFAQENLKNTNFQPNASISLYDVASPYYGNEMQNQYEAAATYASQLAESPYPRVTVPQSYYEQVVKKAPILIRDEPAIYYRSKNIIGAQSPVNLENYSVEYGKTGPTQYANYGENALSSEEVSKNLFQYWRSMLEHEAGHIGDELVKFEPTPKISTPYYDSAVRDFGYMSEEGHLVTGLGKVQREQYAMTGKRFESPTEFKDFIFNLSESKDTEKEISKFSEEARRALRPQIENAKFVKKYYEDLESWKNSWFKEEKKYPILQGNPHLLEKSAQLIPALVQVDNRYNSNV